ncbi:head decoration protein [Acinetobacter gyllenbergii]|uniref:head decoration protein n=1 Tax=Acinetobacter gyllenbergii TaxID=134534 RepID=UPI0003BEA57F|nr:head decoration protein [Acinetobacter gyllenbergii]ESK42127.1 hypothetical protein F987_02148 [Acinetobacter gyllenbergii NIPH 230]
MVQTVTDTHSAISDVIAWELEGNHRPSRKNVTIAASQSLVNGQVIAFDGSGNVIKFSVQATNAAAGIYIGDSVVTGSGQTAQGVIIARDSRYAEGKLVYAAGVTNGEKANAVAALALLNITSVRSV